MDDVESLLLSLRKMVSESNQKILNATMVLDKEPNMIAVLQNKEFINKMTALVVECQKQMDKLYPLIPNDEACHNIMRDIKSLRNQIDSLKLKLHTFNITNYIDANTSKYFH